MKLVLTSDTHGYHRGWTLYDHALPEGDVFVHAGDFSRDHGSWTDVLRFVQWMRELPYKHKVVCPGNHDRGIFDDVRRAQSLFSDHGVHMLGDFVPLELEGFTFGGGPWMPMSGWDPAWAFETPDKDRVLRWGALPKVDVLVTHTPPKGVLDRTTGGEHLGCPSLRAEIFGRLRPKMHVFGHVHEGRGIVVERGITFVNASSNTRSTFVRDDTNKTTHMSMGIRDPFVVEVPVTG